MMRRSIATDRLYTAPPRVKLWHNYEFLTYNYKAFMDLQQHMLEFNIENALKFNFSIQKTIIFEFRQTFGLNIFVFIFDSFAACSSCIA